MLRKMVMQSGEAGVHEQYVEVDLGLTVGTESDRF